VLFTMVQQGLHQVRDMKKAQLEHTVAHVEATLARDEAISDAAAGAGGRVSAPGRNFTGLRRNLCEERKTLMAFCNSLWCSVGRGMDALRMICESDQTAKTRRRLPAAYPTALLSVHALLAPGQVPMPAAGPPATKSGMI